MFGYLLIAISLSAFGGFLFFLILGKPSGFGMLSLAVLVLGGIIWQVKRYKKKK